MKHKPEVHTIRVVGKTFNACEETTLTILDTLGEVRIKKMTYFPMDKYGDVAIETVAREVHNGTYAQH